MFQQIFITEITTSELLVCRACLATDVRLYDMRQNGLLEAYSTLLSTAAQVTDDLPHYLCSYCAALLVKCDTFRIKCINSQTILKNAILPNVTLTLENIKQIDRPTYFRQSYIQTIDIDDTNPKSKDNADNLADAVKDEFDDDDGGDINDTIDNLTDNSKIKINVNSNNQVTSILKKELLIDKNVTSVNVITTRKRKIKTTVSRKQTKMKFEESQSESQTNLVKNKDLFAKTRNNDDFENTDEMNNSISSDDEDEITIADLKINSKSSKCNTKITNVKDKKVVKKKILKAKPSGNKKTENVSKIYNMDEVDLSKEEQLKEIEDRKNSEIYLQAEFKCEFCYKGFRLKESFNSHMVLHDDRSGKLVCDICHCHFLTKKRLCKHKSTHKKKFTCKHGTCKYVTKHLSQAREHYKWHGGVKDTCKHCGKECSGQTSYYHHLKLYHPTSDDLIRCEICGTACSGPLGFKMHEKRTHKEMFSSECLCPGCDTQFYCSAAFKAHQGTDGLCDATHKYCVRCGMAFETEQLLEKHEAEQRKPRTMFKCEVDICQLKFICDVHICEGQLVCEICGKVLSNQHTLKQHYLNKHSTENPFKCTECPKSFRSVINLQLHTRIHTGERPHPCPHCPNTFRSVTNLRRHELVHTDARPHSCEICGKAFKTKADCKAHVQTVHMKIHRPRVRRKYKKTE